MMLISYCETCKNDVPNPLLTAADKKELLALVEAGKKLYAMEFLRSKDYMSLYDSKVFVAHLTTSGKCHHCTYEGLKNDYEVCPSCRALNINLK